MSQNPPRAYTIDQFGLLLWQRKLCVIGCLGVALTLGGLYLLRATPVYTVRARVLVQDEGLKFDEQRRDRDKDFLATQAEIMRSPAVVRSAVELLDLEESAGAASPVLAVMESLKVNPLLGTNVLAVNFSSADAERATHTVEAIIASYRKYVHESQRGAHLESIRLLIDSEKQVRTDLLAMEESFRELRRKSPLIGEAAQSTRLQHEQLAHVGQMLGEAKARCMELQSRLAVVTQRRTEGVANAGASARLVSLTDATSRSEDVVLASGSQLSQLPGVDDFAMWQDENPTGFSFMEEQLFAAQTRERELSQKFGPKHPDVRSVNDQIVHWQTAIQERLAAMPAVLQQQLEAARHQERQLAALYETEFANAKNIDAYQLEEQQALVQIEGTRQTHDSVLTQLRQWQLADQAIAKGGTGVRIDILEHPGVAQSQAWPPTSLLLATFATIGMICGVGMAILLGPQTDRQAAPATQRINGA